MENNMVDKVWLGKQLRTDVIKHLNNFMGSYYMRYASTYYDESGFNLVDDIVNDVMITSAFDDGYYSDDDIKIATGRLIITLIKHPEFV